MAHPAEQRRAYAARYYPERREAIKAHVNAYRADNPDVVIAYQAAYRDKNREALREKQAAYRARRPELVKAHNTKHRVENPGYRGAAQKLRRARQHNAPIADLTLGQWRAIQELFGYRCAYCGTNEEDLTQDHVVSLSKGGSHNVWNVVPACQSCNSKKWTGPPLKPVQPALIV